MAPGDVTQGHRAESVQALYADPPGGYLLLRNADDVPRQGVRPHSVALWFRDPAGHVGRVIDSVHQIVEHEDGTVTVAPSILATTGAHGHDWHGYLERGVWREV